MILFLKKKKKVLKNKLKMKTKLEWVKKLEAVNETMKPVNDNNETEIESGGLKFHDWAESRPKIEGKAPQIPRLCPKTSNYTELQDLSRIEEREYILAIMKNQIPKADEMWSSFMSSSDADSSTAENPYFPSYSAYKSAAMKVVGNSSYHTNSILSPHMYFLTNKNPQNGLKNGLPIFTLATRKALLAHIRMQLELNDSSGEGYLSEGDLVTFIEALMPNLRTVRNIGDLMGGHYHIFYTCHASRKFFFFLDPSRRGRISIDAIMESDVLMEFVKLYQLESPADCSPDEDLPDDLVDNWFTFQIMYRVYQHYVELDTDWNGMLSVSEMAAYNNSSFSAMFIDRVFEVYPTHGYATEIDFKRYLDFVLATENTQSEISASYFWKLLDIGSCNFLARPHVHLFAKELCEKLSSSQLMVVEPEDVAREIFDMVNPIDADKITLSDLKRCGQMNTVLSIIVDHRAFYNYDSRENILAANSLQSREREEDGSSESY